MIAFIYFVLAVLASTSKFESRLERAGKPIAPKAKPAAGNAGAFAETSPTHLPPDTLS
jgi:hypothetical protein